MKKLGKYEILEEIGRGGFGVVYKARDMTLDRIVALKVLHPQLTIDPRFLQRFQQEARTAASFHDPHIITIYEVGEEAGQQYLAMAYLPGWTLDRLLKGKAMSVEGVVTIVEQIAKALDTIHRKGLVHRDVKPGNIIVDKSGQATLLDFGIVRAAEGTRLTTAMTVLGTPEYMSPELAEVDETTDIDWRADVYALGVVAYEMLVGTAPFTGKSPTAVLYKHVHEPPPSPTALRPDLLPGLEPILLKALAKQREKRYQSAGEMARAFREAMEAGKKTLPIEPRPTVREPRRRLGLKLAESIPRKWIGAAGLAAFALFVVILLFKEKALPTPEPVEVTRVVAEKEIVLPTRAPTATVRSSTLRPAPPSSAKLGDTWARSVDGMVMVYVPGGTFEMGSTEGYDDEQPMHDVTLGSFWIDQTEVTNAHYHKCVEDGPCGEPGCWDESELNGPNQPVVCVSWYDAQAYCEWAGGRLPTEAEWEYAARGPQGKTYPWGNTFDGERANFCDANCPLDWKDTRWDDRYERTAPVGSFDAGTSWCAALDMAGNVWEWTSSLYMDYRDRADGGREDLTPSDPRVLRGGGWDCDPNYVRSAKRSWTPPHNRGSSDGFRCAGVATP